MKTKLPEQITTVEEAKAFLTELHKNGESYHPEDDANDIVSGIGTHPGLHLFNQEEGDKLNKLMNDIYDIPGNQDIHKMVFDPCGFLLDLDKKPYRVQAKVSTYCYVYVMANNAEDAREEADIIDGAYWVTEENNRDFEIVDSYEITPDDESYSEALKEAQAEQN